MEDTEPALTLALQRSLGDRSYDKRKGAALEIEATIKIFAEAKDEAKVRRVIDILANEFAASPNPNHRKGGLIGLAACTIGLMADAAEHLGELLPPVLHCFDDPEHRVRYYACEALYNITKVTRGAILPFFNQIFSGLCKLFSDVDMDVKNGANLLDRLVKDVVTESPSFDVDNFVPLLHKYIRKTNPFIRQLLVGWISVLNAVPDINMLDWLPEFLQGLLEMLGDGNRNIRNDAHAALQAFLEDLKTRSLASSEADLDFDLGQMVEILVMQCSAANKLIRHTALGWLREFIAIGQPQLGDFHAIILGASLHCLPDPEPDIRQVASATNQELLSLVDTAGLAQVEDVLRVLKENLVSTDVSVRMACLRWIYVLLGAPGSDVYGHLDSLMPMLLNTLKDASDDVVLLDLEVLARICAQEHEFRGVLKRVVALFAQDPRLLEARGSVIIRRFCFLLDTRSIYMSLAKVLQQQADVEFVALLIHTLNLILLTATELQDLRELLKHSFQSPPDAEDRVVFDEIFRCWSHNPIATLSLCLLAQAYDLAFELVKRFAHIEITVGFLMQADKLVQLLESPIFVPLRLQLLEMEQAQHASLVKALYGLLMLLPQSTAFRTLGSRLEVVGGLHQHLGYQGPGEKRKKKDAPSASDVEELLHVFDETQQVHAAARLEQLQRRAARTDAEPNPSSPES